MRLRSDLWDFPPVIPTFDLDLSIFTSRTCLLVNLAVMPVTQEHFRGSPSTQLICVRLKRCRVAGSGDVSDCRKKAWPH